jgi:hypothetical protein
MSGGSPVALPSRPGAQPMLPVRTMRPVYVDRLPLAATPVRPVRTFRPGSPRRKPAATLTPGTSSSATIRCRRFMAASAGRSDGRLYRQLTPGRWERVRAGCPEPPSTTAPLLCAGAKPGEMWAADERGVHRSDDSEKIGAASSATRRRRSIYAVWPCCGNADETRRSRRGSLPRSDRQGSDSRSTTS